MARPGCWFTVKTTLSSVEFLPFLLSGPLSLGFGLSLTKRIAFDTVSPSYKVFGQRMGSVKGAPAGRGAANP